MNSPLKMLAASVIATTLVALPTMGLAAVDPYPNGCVSCHVLDKDKSVDRRLSVALKEWTAGKIEPGLLAKSKATAPTGLTLKGKHPAAEDSLKTSRAPAWIATTRVRRRRLPSSVCCISCTSRAA
jgi:hypothetical protein